MKRYQKKMVYFDEFEALRKERDCLQGYIETARKANYTLMEEIKQLKAQGTEAHEQFQKRVKELCDELDAFKTLIKNAQDERDVARLEADYLRKRCLEAEKSAEHWKERMEDIKKEKNAIIDISNGFARERDAIQADYDARGKVIKKLRKRIHKLKKKLKH